MYSIKSVDASIKDVDQKKGIVSGYFAAFHSKDADGDIIKPGAFAKAYLNGGRMARIVLSTFLITILVSHWVES